MLIQDQQNMLIQDHVLLGKITVAIFLLILLVGLFSAPPVNDLVSLSTFVQNYMVPPLLSVLHK